MKAKEARARGRANAEGAGDVHGLPGLGNFSWGSLESLEGFSGNNHVIMGLSIINS